ncbi:TlpA family protein disulfide reductase [Psychroserpens sp. BH13MA-6]
MKLYIVTCLLTSLFLGCHSTPDKGEIAYFGGEIINPNNNYITLYATENDRDTIYLDENNRFLHKIEGLTAGVYKFTHGGEYQTIIIEPNDSILFRLNTNDFDESLVYTGEGAKKNNYIIKSFLNDEIENKKIINHHDLEPEAFEKFIEDLRQQKLEYLERFTSTQKTSKLFQKVAQSSIDYNYYAYKEMYPFGYYGSNRLIHFKDLPENFYDFRKDIDYDDVNLSGLAVYSNFIYWHFSNLALRKYYQDGSHQPFDRHSLDYNLEKLRLIDSTISNDLIKNFALTQVTKDFIFNSTNAEESEKILESFLEKNTDEQGKSYLSSIAEASINLHPGNLLPNTKIVDVNNNVLDLRSVINKPTVVYCWSSNFKAHYRNSHYMMRSLKSRYPDMEFIAININDFDLDSWKKTLSLLKFPTENEYIFKNPKEAIRLFAIARSHKVMIVDKKGYIMKANANLFSEQMTEDIESVLALNQ